MIILNEKEYAEECLKSGIVNGKPLHTINILAKYYHHIMGYRKKQIADLLLAFLEKHYPCYVYTKDYWIDSIEHAAQNAGKFELHEINDVRITENELVAIATLGNKVLERLAFTVLCIAKLNNARNPNNNGWVNTEDKEVFKIARISDNTIDRQKRIGKLCAAGLIELPKRIDNDSYRVTFIDDSSPVVLTISDFRELGYEYLRYVGGNFIRCQECNILTRGNKNGTKRYCPNCVAYSPKETKEVTCIDCGELFEISSKNNSSRRCSYCQRVRKRELGRLRLQKHRNKEAM